MNEFIQPYSLQFPKLLFNEVACQEGGWGSQYVILVTLPFKTAMELLKTI